MPARIILSEEQLQTALQAWMNPAITTDAIAAILGIHPRTLERRAREYRWPRRLKPKAAEGGGEEADPAGEGLSPDTVAIATLLGRSVLAEISRLDAQRRDLRGDPAEVARAFASLAKTLVTAQTLQAREARDRQEARSAHDDGEPPPRSLEELRDELARHLDRLVADEEAAGGDDFLHIARACKDP